MRSLAALFALFLGLAPSTARAASLDRDWARIYNPPGNETVLAMWPSPGGGVDIAVDHAGQLTYVQYNSAGTLTAERSTGVGIFTMPFRVLESDGIGGFLVAANQDSLGKIYGLVVMRISPSGEVMWRRVNKSTIYYPKVMQIHAERLYLGVDADYFTTYDPSLLSTIWWTVPSYAKTMSMVTIFEYLTLKCWTTGASSWLDTTTTIANALRGHVSTIGSAAC